VEQKRSSEREVARLRSQSQPRACTPKWWLKLCWKDLIHVRRLLSIHVCGWRCRRRQSDLWDSVIRLCSAHAPPLACAIALATLPASRSTPQGVEPQRLRRRRYAGSVPGRAGGV